VALDGLVKRSAAKAVSGVDESARFEEKLNHVVLSLRRSVVKSCQENKESSLLASIYVDLQKH
jgi:hypothetical protein